MQIIFVMDDGQQIPVKQIKAMNVTANHRIIIQLPELDPGILQNEDNMKSIVAMLEAFFSPAKCQLFLGEMEIKSVVYKPTAKPVAKKPGKR